MTPGAEQRLAAYDGHVVEIAQLKAELAGCRENLAATLESEARNIARAEKAEADNARLRALIKDAEFSNRHQAITDGWCPWCDWAEGEHGPTCPAFTSDGCVR